MTWRFPRFTTLQLLLAAAFCALVLGLGTSSWRSSAVTQVTAVGFSPGGKYLAARYMSGVVLVWDMTGSQPRRVASLKSSTPWSYDTSGIHFADERTLVDISTRSAAAGIQGEIRTLDLPTGRVRKQFDYQGSTEGLLYAAGGDTIAIVEWPAGTIACYSLASGRLVHRLNAGVPSWGLNLDSDGRTLALPDSGGGVRVLNVTTGSITYKSQGQGAFITALSHDGRLLAFCSWQPNVRVLPLTIWDLQENTRGNAIAHKVPLPCWLAFSQDGSRIAIAGEEEAEVHDISSGRCIGRVVFGRVTSQSLWWPWNPSWRSYVGESHFSITPDGRTLATFDGGRVLLWDTTTGKLQTTIADHSLALQVVLFTALFAAWSAAWGIVSRRQWQRTRAEIAPARTASPTPIEVRLCWGLMLIGGLVSLGAPIAMLLSLGPLVWPMFYLALFTGIAAVSRGAARDPRGLSRIALLQLLNIAACDPVNFLLGTLAHSLLRRPHVRQFLHQATGAAQ